MPTSDVPPRDQGLGSPRASPLSPDALLPDSPPSLPQDSEGDDALSAAVDTAMATGSEVNALDDYSVGVVCCSRRFVILPCVPLGTRLRWQSILEHTSITLLMLVLTIYSLFIIDVMQLTMDASAERPVYVSLLVVVAAFAVELMIASVCRPKFFLSFFWWLDTLATVSIALSIPYSQLVQRDCTAMDNTSFLFAQAGRTVRLVRQGGRALRILRVLRIVQVFRFFRWIASLVTGRAQEKSIGSSKVMEASRLGEHLAYTSAKKVVMVIIILSVVLPFYVDEDVNEVAQQLGLLQLALRAEHHGVNETGIAAAVEAMDSPASFTLLRLEIDGVQFKNDPAGIARLRCDELSEVLVTGPSGLQASATFGNSPVLNSRSSFNLVYICLVLVVLLVSTLLFNRDTRRYVVKPMMRIIRVLNELRKRVAETVLSFDERGWDPVFVERTVYDMALWIETQQAKNLLPTSEERRLEALRRAHRKAEAARLQAGMPALPQPRTATATAKPPGQAPVARRGAGGSLVLFGTGPRLADDRDGIRRQVSALPSTGRPGARGSGSGSFFGAAQQNLQRLWREAKGMESDDEDVVEMEVSPPGSPTPPPALGAQHHQTALQSGRISARRQRSASAGAWEESMPHGRRHVVEEIPVPRLPQGAAARGGSLILAPQGAGGSAGAGSLRHRGHEQGSSGGSILVFSDGSYVLAGSKEGGAKTEPGTAHGAAPKAAPSALKAPSEASSRDGTLLEVALAGGRMGSPHPDSNAAVVAHGRFGRSRRASIDHHLLSAFYAQRLAGMPQSITPAPPVQRTATGGGSAVILRHTSSSEDLPGVAAAADSKAIPAASPPTAVPPRHPATTTTPTKHQEAASRAGASDASDTAKYFLSPASDAPQTSEGGGLPHRDSMHSMASYLEDAGVVQGEYSPAAVYVDVGAEYDQASTGSGSHESVVNVTLPEDASAQVPVTPPPAPAAAATADTAPAWSSPWSLSAAEQAEVDAVRMGQQRAALRQVLRTAALRGEDLPQALAAKVSEK